MFLRTGALPPICLAILTSWTPNSASAQSSCPQVALVLAFDASGSINEAEYQLQTHGSGLALMDPAVLELIGAQGGIALAAVVWSDDASGVYTVPWHFVTDEHSMASFANAFVSAPRIPMGNTDIGNGLWHALDLLVEAGGCASRKLINVSGDGRETPYARGRTKITVADARARADAEGVIINGLAITRNVPDLAAYYEQNVKTGPGSFVVEILAYADFQTAMREKLLREIAEPLVGDNSHQGPDNLIYASINQTETAPFQSRQ